MSLIEVRQVTKQFRKGSEVITPLETTDLDVQAGEFISLMGASGTGKSTLLNLIAGIDRPTSGRIVVNGTDITSLSRTRLANWRAANIGYIFQTHNLIPVLTAYENIELPLLLLPLSRSERRRRVQIAMQAVSLTDRANHYPAAALGRTGTAGRHRTGDRRRSDGGRGRRADGRSGPAHCSGDSATDPETQYGAQDDDRCMVTHDVQAASIAQRQFQLDHGKLVEAGRPQSAFAHQEVS